MFEQVLAEFSTLVGFAALVSVVVNILKSLNVVKDGTADKWVAGFNFFGVIALYVLRLIVPEFQVLPVDSVLGEIAVVGGFIGSFILAVLGSKVTYAAIKGLPFIGKSNSG